MFISTVSFHGKLAGALGICYRIRTEVKSELSNVNSIREALYSTGDINGVKYESVTVLQIICVEEIKDSNSPADLA